MNRSAEQDVVTTVLANHALAEGLGNVGQTLARHRGLLHHQVVVMSDFDSSSGAWRIRYLPDDRAENRSADTGLSLALSGSDSALRQFTAALRGVILEQTEAGQTGRRLTFVITSSRGPLIT